MHFIYLIVVIHRELAFKGLGFLRRSVGDIGKLSSLITHEAKIAKYLISNLTRKEKWNLC